MHPAHTHHWHTVIAGGELMPGPWQVECCICQEKGPMEGTDPPRPYDEHRDGRDN